MWKKEFGLSHPEESWHLITMLQEKAKDDKDDQLINLIDPCSSDMKSHLDEVFRVVNLAVWCLQVDNNRRPSMCMVVKTLERTMSAETKLELSR